MMMVVRSCRREPSAERIRCSEIESRAEVGSSRMRMGASLRNARASEMRCRCPPERSRPFSLTIVSSPSGSSSRNSVT